MTPVTTVIVLVHGEGTRRVRTSHRQLGLDAPIKNVVNRRGSVYRRVRDHEET
jgi:hypothetical protein